MHVSTIITALFIGLAIAAPVNSLKAMPDTVADISVPGDLLRRDVAVVTLPGGLLKRHEVTDVEVPGDLL
jgi:hypothetical protein